jgi:hypothetical protein
MQARTAADQAQALPTRGFLDLRKAVGERGYREHDRTLVLTAALSEVATLRDDDDIVVRDAPSAEWLET